MSETKFEAQMELSQERSDAGLMTPFSRDVGMRKNNNFVDLQEVFSYKITKYEYYSRG